jgi:hypothetical protein
MEGRGTEAESATAFDASRQVPRTHPERGDRHLEVVGKQGMDNVWH